VEGKWKVGGDGSITASEGEIKLSNSTGFKHQCRSEIASIECAGEREGPGSQKDENAGKRSLFKTRQNLRTELTREEKFGPKKRDGTKSSHRESKVPTKKNSSI